MLSLYQKRKDEIVVDGISYAVDCNFNIVLANLELSQNEKINDFVKIKVALKNYLDVSDEQLYEWGIQKQAEVYNEISSKLFGLSQQKQSNSKNINSEDKSAYSFSEDADFIYASFMKDYGINLLEMRNKMHWDEFKALFVSLSKDTKMVEVMQIRNWKKSEHDSPEYVKQMRELQESYALYQSQEEFENIQRQKEIIADERHKMSQMTSDERVEYAKEKLKELKEGN